MEVDLPPLRHHFWCHTSVAFLLLPSAYLPQIAPEQFQAGCVEAPRLDRGDSICWKRRVIVAWFDMGLWYLQYVAYPPCLRLFELTGY